MSLLRWSGVAGVLAVVAAICAFAGFGPAPFHSVCKFAFFILLLLCYFLAYLSYVHKKKADRGASGVPTTDGHHHGV